MTVIAWDGKTLAADKRTNCGGLHATTTKLRKSRGLLIGMSGEAAHIAEMHHWFETGADPEKLPALQRDAARFANVLVVNEQGSLLEYANSPFPILIENKFWAIGSGRDFAMAAMHLGKSAREAVEVASALASCCGNGVDTLELA